MTGPTLDSARETLRQRFGYAAFRPGQERAVGAVLAGRDTLVILPTGGGKSLCYQVPALVLPSLTVVVSPLISLMKDQVDTLIARGVPAAAINSTMSASAVSDVMARAQRGALKILYVAPERFDAGTTAPRLRAIGVSLLAIDEAHCVSEWGHDFRPSYLRLADVRRQLGQPAAIALTATATPEVRRDIVRQLEFHEPETVITGFDRTNLTYHVVRTRGDEDKDDALVRIIGECDGATIVYASTRKAVDRVTAVLEGARIGAVAYHAGLDDTRRRAVQEAFMREQARVIVATNAFGMGIDKPNVRLVVHHAMPGTLEAYYQEAGRAGRDGNPSACVLLHAFPDRFTHEFFIKGANPEREIVERVYAAMQRTADGSGMVRGDARTIAAVVGSKVSDREVGAAMRILANRDALAIESESDSRLLVRLLATPERIRRELDEPHAAERDLLRALWRLGGEQLYQGMSVDAASFAPGFGGAIGVRALLESLQSRQFVLCERVGGGIRLVRPAASLSSFNVDWRALDHRRKVDLAKLDAMQKYAYAKSCRRGFVLRYFGDPAARNRCGACDVCLGTHAPLAAGRPDVARARSRGRRASPRELDDTLSPGEQQLLSSLKALRGRIAREQQVPAYVVFSDRTLAEMARRRPRSLLAMQDVRGIGPAKLEKYGARFLAAIRDGDGTEAA